MMMMMILLLILFEYQYASAAQNVSTVAFNVGVVLDLNSSVGKTSLSCIKMAHSDFYSTHSFYKTRLVLHPKDSKNDNIGAASAALDLLKNMEVQAIIGPETSVQVKFVVDMGDKAQVPIISFSASSPSPSSSQSPYFIRTSQNDSSQVKAIKAVVQAFTWKEIIPIYEDTDYGNGLIPYLIGSFQEIDVRLPYKSVISPFATDIDISKELEKLITMQARVFIVHMNPSLGSRLFFMAKAKGRMTKGYSWIITDSMTNLLSSMDSSVIESMQGVLGVSPYVPKSKKLDSFRIKWKKKFLQDNLDIERTDQPSIYDLWAYDTVWALAMAAEEVGNINTSPFQKPKLIDNSSDLTLMLGVSPIGPKLLETIRKIRFRGLSGEFHLVDGQLQSSIFQIHNVIGNGGREIGFWTPKDGLLRELSGTNSSGYSTSMSNLRCIIWPGESKDVPKGWAAFTNGRKLRIGVPRKGTFIEFVNVETNFTNVTATGYSIDVFNAIIETLPYSVPYEFVTCPECKNYNELVEQVYHQKFDALVGDTTILPNRSLYVDFTLPYTETGISMIVKIIKDDEKKNSWVFLKPLSKEMWFSTLSAFIFTGCVIWVLEHRINKNFRGSPSQQLGMIFWFSFSTIVFAHREKVRSNLSRLVLIIWVFVVLIITSSYTASLTSTLTVQQLAVSDIDQLIRNGDYVGYQNGSYVKGVLKRLHFDESKLRAYDTLQDYAYALSNGSQKGGVAAIFDETPYLKMFLSNYCDKYAMVGPSYNSNGFGFVFRKGSPLVLDVSKAMSDGKGNEKIMEIDFKWFGNQTCEDPRSTVSADNLTIDSFRGLFLITIVTSCFALFIWFGSFLHKHMHILTNSPAGSENNSITQRVVNLAIRFYKSEDEYPSHSSSKKTDDHELENQEMQVMDSSISSQQTRYLNTHNNIEEDGITSLDELDNSSMDSRNDVEIEISPTE